MKINYWLIFVASVHSFWLYSDGKITQMIYAEGQYNPYANEDGQRDRKIVYYLKDKKLYMHDAEDDSDLKNDYEMPIYQFKDKQNQKKWEQDATWFYKDPKKDKYKDWYEDEFETIGLNIMHIGQPTKITAGDVSRWAMPLVIKEHWILGNLFRTDLCVIEQVKIKEDAKKDDFKFVGGKEGEKSTTAEEKKIYLLRKIGVGHRAPTNFVGLWNVKNIDELGENEGWAIISSSTWPTLKWRFLDIRTHGKEFKNNEYVLDSQLGRNGFILIAKKYTSKGAFRWAKKEKVGIEKLILYTKSQEQDTKTEKLIKDIIKKEFPLLLFDPSIIIDPGYFLTKNPSEELDTIINNLTPVLTKIKTLEDCGTISKQVKVYLYKDGDSLIIPENDWCRQLIKSNINVDFSMFDKKLKDIITSSSFDFKTRKLFLGVYNEKTKKSDIQIIDI